MKFSIIIPHKNTPVLLERCLNSIPERDDLEIIIVDDNSDSSIVDFDLFPGLNRKNTKCIFSKEGKGAGYARNIGLEHACGYWVYFADADDYLTEAFNSVFDKYQNITDIDMVFLNAGAIDEFGCVQALSISRYIDNYLAHRPYALSVLRYGFWSPWSRLVKRDIFEKSKIQFEEVPTGNDVMGIVLASKYSQTFAAELQICYMYYKPTSGSQTAAAYNEDSYIQRLEQKFRLNLLYEEMKYPFLWPIHSAFNNVVYNKSERVKAIKQQYNYSYLLDQFIFLKYAFAKILKIL